MSEQEERGAATAAPRVPPGDGGPASTGACPAPPWVGANAYLGGDQVSHDGMVWRAKWWTYDEPPKLAAWSVWEPVGPG